MANTSRPLSPHLQIYRPQLTSVLSILHRMTGGALVIGTLLLVYWLTAAAAGPAPADARAGLRFQQRLTGHFGRLDQRAAVGRRRGGTVSGGHRS